MPSESTVPPPRRLHPILRGPDGPAWMIPTSEGIDATCAWRTAEGDVVIQDRYGDLTIPAKALPRVAEALLAVHVHNGRPDAKASTT